MPRVTTIIPCHNDARWVGRAIESALTQTYRDHEVLVVDDGSSDDTPAVLARYEARARLMRQPNRGVAAARNTGIAHATGEFLAFLDADDVFAPDKVARQVAVLEQDARAGLIYTDVWETPSHGAARRRVTPRRFPPDRYLVPLFLFQTNWFPSSVLVRRAVLRQVGAFDETLRRGEDRDLWMRIAHAWRIQDIAAPLVVRTVRRDSVSASAEGLLDVYAYVERKIVARAPELAAYRRRRRATAYLRVSAFHWQRREFVTAARSVARSVALDPLSREVWGWVVRVLRRVPAAIVGRWGASR